MRFRLFFLTAAATLIPVAASALGTDVIINGKAVTFVDVPQSAWFMSYVRDAAQAGIVNGYKNIYGNLTGKFGPADNITIAQALKIAVEGAGYDTDAYSSVIESGVGSHWASPYVSVAKAEHFAIFSGGGVRASMLDRAATRAEVASIFTSAFHVNMDVSADASYSDVRASTTYATSIYALTRDKVVEGDTTADGSVSGTFRPGSFINRAEVVKIVMTARTAYDMPGEGRAPSSASTETSEPIVHYTNTGFTPQVLHVKLGTAVSFQNDTTTGMWVEGTGIDAGKSYSQGGTYIQTFNSVGTWQYRNRYSASDVGTIIVEQ
jgi:plastocyanin